MKALRHLAPAGVVVVGLIVFSACAGTDSGVEAAADPQDARSALRAAADRTLDAPRLHGEIVTEWEVDQVTERVVFDYRSPDRVLTVFEQDGERTKVIEVEGQWWASSPYDENRYQRSNRPLGGGLDHLEALLRQVVLQASTITMADDQFSLMWDDEDSPPALRGIVTVRRGYVARLELNGLRANGVQTRTTAEIVLPERPPEIEAPPPELVDEVVPSDAEPLCGPDGKATAPDITCDIDLGWPPGDDSTSRE